MPEIWDPQIPTDSAKDGTDYILIGNSVDGARKSKVGAPGGPAILDANGKIINRLAYEGQANGVALLDGRMLPIDGRSWVSSGLPVAYGANTVQVMHNVQAANQVELAVYAHQGLARDADGYWYAIDTQQVSKISPDNTTVVATANPASGLVGDHIGDGNVANGYLWLPVEVYNGGQPSNQQLAKVQLSDLSLVGVWDLNPNYEAAGVALYGEYVYVASYQGEGVAAYKINGGTLNHLGMMRLSHYPRYVNGIAIRNGRMALWAAYVLYIYDIVSPTEAVLTQAINVVGTSWSEGVIWDTDGTIIVHAASTTQSWRYDVAVPTTYPTNVGDITHVAGGHELVVFPPPTGQLYMRATIPQVSATSNLMDSQIGVDYSEMWVYTSGALNLKLGDGATIYGGHGTTLGSPTNIRLRWWQEADGMHFDLQYDGITYGPSIGNPIQLETWYLPGIHTGNPHTPYTIHALGLYHDMDDHSSEVFA